LWFYERSSKEIEKNPKKPIAAGLYFPYIYIVRGCLEEISSLE
jgi:hypothetical protein